MKTELEKLADAYEGAMKRAAELETVAAERYHVSQEAGKAAHAARKEAEKCRVAVIDHIRTKAGYAPVSDGAPEHHASID